MGENNRHQNHHDDLFECPGKAGTFSETAAAGFVLTYTYACSGHMERRQRIFGLYSFRAEIHEHNYRIRPVSEKYQHATNQMQLLICCPRSQLGMNHNCLKPPTRACCVLTSLHVPIFVVQHHSQVIHYIYSTRV